jgi:release factor glutamine methyltransferase
VNAGDALRDATQRLKDAGVDAPRADARILLHRAVAAASGTLLPETAPISLENEKLFAALVERRIAREPLAYILGSKQFWDLDLEVGPGVLVPRPETELLIEELERCFPQRDDVLRFVDCGTGSGCLLVTALMMFPNARGVGVDSSDAALKWARANVARYGLGARCELRMSDWSQGTGVDADAILANPPYIKSSDLLALAPEVARYEPTAALDGGPDGLDAYRSLAPLAEEGLKPGGFVLFEIGEGQADAIRVLLAQTRLETIRVVPDLAGISRCIVAQKAR